MSKKKGNGKKAAAPAAPKAPAPRRAILAISPAAFMSLFSGRHTYEVAENPLPPGAAVIDVRLNGWNGKDAVEVLIEHPSIPELVDGQPVPYVKPPTFKNIEIPAPKKK